MGDGIKTDNERLLPDVYPSGPVAPEAPRGNEPYDPFFDVDWSVGLRGTFTKATAGERFDVRLAPNVSLEHIGSRSAISVNAGAELVRPNETGTVDIGALRLGIQGGYNLDRDTRLSGNGNFALTQQSVGTPGLASDVSLAPRNMTGGGDIGITRQFGKFNVGVTGAAQRNVFGVTTYSNGNVVDNADQNYTAYDAGLRVGYQVTPIFEVFGEAGLGRDVFDHASASLLVRPDATDTTLRGGVVGRWSETLEATASTGVALRRFDAASLGEVVTQLYDARVVFTPDRTWRMSAGLATTVAPPGTSTSGGTTRVQYAVNADVAYTVNSWLALRAFADWNTAKFIGTSNVENGHGVGVGADYRLNAHTAVSADYGYDFADSTTNGVQEAHRVTLGLTVSR